MTEKLSLENFNVEMMPKLVELFSSYFGPDDRLLSEGYNSWLYSKNPFGPAKVTVISENDKWLGFMALIPVRFQRKGSCLSGYFGANVLVHPEQHGKNMFGKMISAAHGLLAKENMVLMGHPNRMAIRSWQRAGMTFFQPLKLWWIVPRRLTRGITRSVVKSLDGDSDLWRALEAQRMQASSWEVVISAEILKWRFLDHPTNSYELHWLEAEGVPVGVQIMKKMRYGISLLIDSFVLDEYAERVLGGLPWRTLSLKPCETSAGRLKGYFAHLSTRIFHFSLRYCQQISRSTM